MSEPRRKSAFATANPIAAPTPTTTRRTPEAPEVTKLTVRLPRPLAERLRTAFMLDGPPRGIMGYQAWITECLQKELDRVERERGPVAPTEAGNLPRGWAG